MTHKVLKKKPLSGQLQPAGVHLKGFVIQVTNGP